MRATSIESDIIVLGGGAAGFMAAIACRNENRNAEVVILEKSDRILAKVRVSGGGRCNVTHACFDPKELVSFYPRGSKELLGAFHRWQPSDTVEWFESRGVPLKVESDGRMFPKSDRSSDVVQCLVETARKAGVRIRTGVGCASIQPCREGSGFELLLNDGRRAHCRKLLIATGGLKPGALYKCIEDLGHGIEPLAPSLFAFHIRDPRLAGLQGLSAPRVMASIPGESFEQSGAALITHQGLSGPAILKLSAWAARWIHQRNCRFTARVNWSGIADPSHFLDQLRRIQKEHPDKKPLNLPLFELPRRLWERLVRDSLPDSNLRWRGLSDKDLEAMMRSIMRAEFEVSGKTMNKEEFVTCGGVRLRDIDFKRMESRIVRGLHFAGEVLDVDAVTGGFNFQAAWTTGLLAGQAMAEE